LHLGNVLIKFRAGTQIIPSATKALLDSLKTSSYHIKTVLECGMPKKDSSTVRLVIQRDLTKKRYDFEADSRASASKLSQLMFDGILHVAFRAHAAVHLMLVV
jgi:hypothetical protein